jgi:cation:H+ antiporter
MLDYFLVALGLILLVAGGEVVLRGALGLSTRLGLSPAIIGAVVMGFGTSSPELAASMTAALAGEPGIALGNVIGSNVANIALILALTVLVAPIAVRMGLLDAVALTGATLAMVAVLLLGGIGPVLGAAFLVGLAAYLWASLRAGQVELPEAEEGPPPNLWISVGFVVVGLALLVGGAQTLVEGAVNLATDFGVPPAVIGLTVVAVGTSLPELAASLAAAVRGQGAMALGNIVGSNIFNVLGILGLTALLEPITVTPAFGIQDIASLIMTAAALIALGFWGRIGRVAGVAGLVGYGLYVAAVLA